MYAGWPPTLTVTLSSVVGRLPLTMALAQVSVVAARKPPLMVSHALVATPGRKLAPFCTSVMMGLVSAPTAKLSDWLLAPPMERITGRLPLGVVPGSRIEIG